MKRNFKLLVAVLVLAVMVLTLASCDVLGGVIDKIKPHEHEYSADWSSDATNHWHAALCDDAEPADVAAHTFAEGVCSVCGYEKPDEETPVCTHEAMTSEVVKEATCTEAGEKKFTCTDCGYSYTKEIAILDHTIEKLEAVEPTCTENGLGKGEKCSVCGTILKAQSVIESTGHDFVDGVCSNCGDKDPEYKGSVTYVFDVQTIEAFAASANNLGKILSGSFDDFFTFYLSDKTKAESGKKATFEDGYAITNGIRLNLNGGTSINSIPAGATDPITKNALKFVVPEGYTATVKVWWTCGGDGREVAIFDEDGEFVVASEHNDEFAENEGTGSAKNAVYLDTLSLNKCGTFYLGTDNSMAPKSGGNILWKVEVTINPAEDQDSGLNGSGTYSEPYILPETGDYTTDAAGLVFYQYTALDNGYVIVSSDWADGSVWIKIGTDIYALNDNQSGGSIEYFATKGSVVYIAVSDRNEVAEAVPFKVSFEKVDLGSVEAFVGSWKLEVSNWYGTITYIFNINEDGTGTAVEKAGYSEHIYDLSAIVIDNVAIVNIVDEDNNSYAFNFTHNSESGSYTATNDAMGISGELLPYDGEGDGPDANISYDTVIVSGANTLYFSADEISANTATRKLTITVAGNYKFASGNLFVAGVVDANGNAVAQNDDYTYTLAEGEYTLTFGMLSMFGVAADTACELGVTIPEAVDPGTGDGGNDEYPEFVVDELKEAVLGWYEFTGYSIGLYTNYDLGMYLANVYGEGFDLYFTFDVNANDDGSYTITLSHYYVDYETNPDMIETVLGYNIVIGGASEEPVEATDITTLPGTGASADPFVITESNHYFLTNVNTYPGYLVSFGSDKDITVTIKADIAELYSKSWAAKYAEENKEYTFTVKAGETLAMWVVMESVTAEKVVISVSIKDAEVTEPDDGGDNNDQAAANATLNGTYAYQPQEGQAFVVTFNNGLITVVRDDLYMGLPASFEYNYSPATGSITTEYGYFYVDLYTGSLYYGRGWLLAPYVVEDEPVVPTTPTLQLGDNTVTVTDTWNGTTLVLTATEAITYVITPGANAVVSYDYSNYFAGDKLEISLVAGASAEIIVFTEDWTTGDVVVNLAEKAAQGGGSVEEGEPNSADLSFTAPGGNMAKSEEQTFVAAGSCDYVITATGYDAIVKTYLQYYDAASDSWTRIDTELPYTITLSAGQELKLRLFGWSNDDAGKEIIVHIAPAAGSSETV